jgi:hypothetical protein
MIGYWLGASQAWAVSTWLGEALARCWPRAGYARCNCQTGVPILVGREAGDMCQLSNTLDTRAQPNISNLSNVPVVFSL